MAAPPPARAAWHHALPASPPSSESVVPFVLLVVLVALAVSAAGGGRLRNIASAPLHHSWLLATGVALQVAVDLAAARGLLIPGHGVTYLLLLTSQLLVVGWVIVNRHLRGLWLVGTGLLLNALVMGANGAMPVSPEAIAALGIEGAQVPPGKHMLLTESTRLPWLADIIPVPPIRSIISIGDLVLAAGLVPVTHTLMTWPLEDEAVSAGTTPPAG